MKWRLRGAGATAALAILCAACSPALNWRTIQLQDLSATLPCKPDQGERTVLLGGQNLAMQMKGCEADGALFAISHVAIVNASKAGDVQQAWRAAALKKLNAAERPNPSGVAPTSSGATPETVAGTGEDGAPVQAALVWRVAGVHIYHLAVYAKKISPEMTEPFFTGASLP